MSGTGGAQPAAGHSEAADWLCLAAAPAFAMMATLTSVFGGGPQEMFCSAAHGVSSLSGMCWMYLLMAAFHSAPWLKLAVKRESGAPSC